VPHAPFDWLAKGVHIVPLQQPFGHEAALHTQVPWAEQVWPVAQGAQAAPPTPQVGGLEVRHWPVESQQPFGHEVALHTQAPVALHVRPVAQGAHWAPLAPHADGDVVMHWPLAQQPAQLMLPQPQAPLLHACPVAHVPQLFPFEPHAAVDCADGATHRCCESQQPPGQDAALHTHAPAGPHAWPAAQPAQVAPRVPHAPADWPA
jgi:hypothetical protein